MGKHVRSVLLHLYLLLFTHVCETCEGRMPPYCAGAFYLIWITSKVERTAGVTQKLPRAAPAIDFVRVGQQITRTRREPPIYKRKFFYAYFVVDISSTGGVYKQKALWPHAVSLLSWQYWCLGIHIREYRQVHMSMRRDVICTHSSEMMALSLNVPENSR